MSFILDQEVGSATQMILDLLREHFNSPGDTRDDTRSASPSVGVGERPGTSSTYVSAMGESMERLALQDLGRCSHSSHFTRHWVMSGGGGDQVRKGDRDTLEEEGDRHSAAPVPNDTNMATVQAGGDEYPFADDDIYGASPPRRRVPVSQSKDSLFGNGHAITSAVRPSSSASSTSRRSTGQPAPWNFTIRRRLPASNSPDSRFPASPVMIPSRSNTKTTFSPSPNGRALEPLRGAISPTRLNNKEFLSPSDIESSSEYQPEASPSRFDVRASLSSSSARPEIPNQRGMTAVFSAPERPTLLPPNRYDTRPMFSQSPIDKLSPLRPSVASNPLSLNQGLAPPPITGPSVPPSLTNNPEVTPRPQPSITLLTENLPTLTTFYTHLFRPQTLASTPDVSMTLALPGSLTITLMTSVHARRTKHFGPDVHHGCFADTGRRFMLGLRVEDVHELHRRLLLFADGRVGDGEKGEFGGLVQPGEGDGRGLRFCDPSGHCWEIWSE